MNYRKYISMALTASLAFGLSMNTYAEQSTNSNTSFTDIQLTPWAEKSITHMYLRNIVSGYEDNTFKPQQGIKQVEALSMVVGFLGYSDEAEQYKLMEVKEDNPRYKVLQGVPAWAKGAVLVGFELNLINSTSSAGFNADEPASRAWIMHLLVEALRLHGTLENKTNNVSFTDMNTIPDWAQQSVISAAKAKVISGYEDGTFRPYKTVTRAEMMVMLVGFEQYLKSDLKSDLITGTIEIDQGDAIIVNVGNDKLEKKYFASNAIVYTDQEKISTEQIMVGDKISAIMDRRGNLVFVDIIQGVNRSDTTITGDIHLIDAGRNQIIIEDNNDSLLTYNLSSNTIFEKNNAVIGLADLRTNDQVRLIVSGDQVKSVIVTQGYESLNTVEVVGLNLEKKVLTVQKSGGELDVYSITNSVNIVDQLNNPSSITDIREGDRISLSFQGEVLSQIQLQHGYLKGITVKSINVSKDEMELLVDGRTVTHKYSKDMKVDISGVRNANEHDIQKDDTLDLTIVNNEIVGAHILNRSIQYYIYNSVDTSAKFVKVQSPADGKYYYLKYTDNITLEKNNQTLSSWTSLSSGERVQMTFINTDQVDKIEAVNYARGVIKEINTLEKVIKIQENGYTSDKYLMFTDSLILKINGSQVSLDKLSVGDYVQYYHLDDTFVEIQK